LEYNAYSLSCFVYFVTASFMLFEPLVIKYNLLVKVGEHRQAQEIHNVYLALHPMDRGSTILYAQTLMVII
jgi:hypothetical protein